MKFRLLALIAVVSVLGSEQAFARATCFCKVSIRDLTNKSSAGSGVIKDYGSLASYGGIFQQSNSNQNDCRSKCSNAAGGDTGSAALAKAACAAGASNGTAIRAYAAVGTKSYSGAQTIGILKRTNPVYSCPNGGSYEADSMFSGGGCVITKKQKVTCPEGYWLEDHKAPAKCVKQACAPGSMPGVPAWAGIGGNVNGGNYLTDDKGGSRFFINARAGCEPGFRKVNSNTCLMQYPAKLDKAGSCSF